MGSQTLSQRHGLLAVAGGRDVVPKILEQQCKRECRVHVVIGHKDSARRNQWRKCVVYAHLGCGAHHEGHAHDERAALAASLAKRP